jgi:hypothetical protein
VACLVPSGDAPMGAGIRGDGLVRALTKMLDETKDRPFTASRETFQKSLSASSLILEIARHPGVLALS